MCVRSVIGHMNKLRLSQNLIVVLSTQHESVKAFASHTTNDNQFDSLPFPVQKSARDGITVVHQRDFIKIFKTKSSDTTIMT